MDSRRARMAKYRRWVLVWFDSVAILPLIIRMVFDIPMITAWLITMGILIGVSPLSTWIAVFIGFRQGNKSESSLRLILVIPCASGLTTILPSCVAGVFGA